MSGFLPLHESLKQEAGSAVLSTDAQLIPNNMQLECLGFYLMLENLDMGLNICWKVGLTFAQRRKLGRRPCMWSRESTFSFKNVTDRGSEGGAVVLSRLSGSDATHPKYIVMMLDHFDILVSILAIVEKWWERHLWLSESTFSLHVDDDEDVFNGDNDDFKDYGGDGVNVRIDILCEKLAWRNGSHVFPTAASLRWLWWAAF